METRAKDLKDFTMWNSTNPSIEFLNLSDAIFSKFCFPCGYFPISSSEVHGIGFSKLNDEFAMPFFYDKIGKDLPANVKQSMSRYNPFVTISFKEFVTSFFNSCRTSATECFLKPFKKALVGIGNFQNGAIVSVFVAISRFIFKLAGMKASFSINDTSKVSKMRRIMDFGFIKNSMFMVDVVKLHVTPIVTGSPTSIHLMCI